MGTYAESAFHEDTSAGHVVSKSSRLALVAVFSALIAVGTILFILGYWHAGEAQRLAARARR